MPEEMIVVGLGVTLIGIFIFKTARRMRQIDEEHARLQKLIEQYIRKSKI